MHVRLGQSDGRSVLPQVPGDGDIDLFELYGSIDDTEEKYISFYDTEGRYLEEVTNLEDGVAYVRGGTWRFTLNAYKQVDDEFLLVLQGSKTITLSDEAVQDVVFDMEPVSFEGEHGRVNLTITLPASSGAASVVTTLDGETVTPALTIQDNAGVNAVTYQEELPEGDYLISLTFKDANDRALAVVTEILVVRSNLLSAKTIELSASHFNAPPAAPDGFSKDASGSSVSFSWEDRSVNETGFVISGGTGGPYIVAAGATSYTITAANVSDEYTIKAVNDFGESEAITAVGALPKPPAGLTVSSITATSVTLAWNEVNGAVSYNIYRSSGAYGDYGLIGTAYSTAYTDSGLTSGSTYYYQVSAVNGSQVEGTLSASVSSQTNTLPPAAAPAGLWSTAKTQTSITLSWNWVSGATGYYLYRNAVYIATVSSTYYTDSGLVPGTAYTYRVSAYNSTGEGPQSSAYSVTTESLSAPSGVYAIPVSGGIRINWNAVSGASSYTVYRATSASGTYTSLGTVTATTFLNTVSGSGTYYYKVAANSSAGLGYQSGYVSSPAGGTLATLPNYSTTTWLRASIANGGVQYYRYEAKAGYTTLSWADKYDGGDVTFTTGSIKEKATADIVVSAWWESDGASIFTKVDDGYYNYSSATTFYSSGAYVIIKVETYDTGSGGRYFIH
jgi:fibronectin type 3 domain-containing protein